MSEGGSRLAKAAQAKMVLGRQLVANILLRPFAKDRGPQPWLRRLGAEGLGKVPAGVWERFEPASRCLGCGLCDSIPLPPSKGTKGDDVEFMSWADVGRRNEGVAALVVGAGRQPADACIEAPRVAVLRRVAEEIAAICPARVGVEDIAEIVAANARQIADEP